MADAAVGTLTDLGERLFACPEVAAIRGANSVAIVASGKAVADAPTRFVVMSARRQPLSFGLCSTHVAPGFVDRAVAKAAEIRAALPADLGDAVLLPSATWLVDGCSAAIYPFLRTFREGRLSGRIHRMMYREAVLQWLHAAVSATRVDANLRETRSLCDSLTGFPNMVPHVVSLGRDAIRALDNGSWSPITCVSHSDFWWGNVLPDSPHPAARFPFRIIDWGGSSLEGFPGLDLLRALKSFQFSTRAARRHLAQHSQASSLSTPCLGFELAAGLGRIAINLEQFPADRFVTMCADCVRDFQGLAFA